MTKKTMKTMKRTRTNGSKVSSLKPQPLIAEHQPRSKVVANWACLPTAGLAVSGEPVQHPLLRYQNVNRATIWPDRGWAPPLPGLPPFTQFTNPQPDDNRPVTPLKLFARPVGVVMVVAPLSLGN